MELSPAECATYATVAPIFLVAAVAASSEWVRGPRTKAPGAPAPITGVAVILAGVAAIIALDGLHSGLSGAQAWIVVHGTRLSAVMVVMLGAALSLIPHSFYDWAMGRGDRKAARRAARRAARAARRDEVLRAKEEPEPQDEHESEGGGPRE